MNWIGWALVGLGVVAGVGLIGYWAVVLTEGAYLGARAVRAIYDWGASSYDEVKQYNPNDEYWFLGHPIANRLAELGRRSLLLDVATGTARLPLAVSRDIEFDGFIVGLDLSDKMLAEAATKTATYGRRIALMHHPAAPLPFDDASFDAVTMLEALEFLPTPDETLREMVRVLRPGGWFIVSNRIGNDARWLPGRAHDPARFEQRLAALGLEEIYTKPWQEYYDLIWAQKGPLPEPPAEGAPKRRRARPTPLPATWPWLASFRCPRCRAQGQWEQRDDALHCQACGHDLPIRDRIIQAVG